MNKPRLTARSEECEFAYFPHCFEEPCLGNGCGERREECRFLDDVCERLCELEDKLERGELLEPPVRIGDTVYAVVDDEFARPIEPYRVCGLAYKGGEWYALDETQADEFLVGGELCCTSFEKAACVWRETKKERKAKQCKTQST